MSLPFQNSVRICSTCICSWLEIQVSKKNFRIGIRPHRDSTPNSPTIPAGSLYHLERGSGSFLKQLLRKFEVRLSRRRTSFKLQIGVFLVFVKFITPARLPSAHLEFLRYIHYMRSTYLVFWLKQPCGRLKVRDCERGANLGIAV